MLHPFETSTLLCLPPAPFVTPSDKRGTRSLEGHEITGESITWGSFYSFIGFDFFCIVGRLLYRFLTTQQFHVAHHHSRNDMEEDKNLFGAMIEM